MLRFVVESLALLLGLSSKPLLLLGDVAGAATARSMICENMPMKSTTLCSMIKNVCTMYAEDVKERVSEPWVWHNRSTMSAEHNLP